MPPTRPRPWYCCQTAKMDRFRFIQILSSGMRLSQPTKKVPEVKFRRHKIRVIKKAIGANKPDAKDAIDVLSKVGGFEIGGLAGIILAAAANKVPVVIDGFISGAAALVAFKIEPKVKDYLIAAHCSVETGHKVILEHIGLKPLLDLNLRLGEGTGAALGIGLADAAIKILTQMATFKSANVSEKKE